MFKVVRTYRFKDYDSELERKTLGDNIELIERPSPTEDDLIANCQDADAVICAYEPFTQRVIDALPNLKLINFKTVAFNMADYEYAKTKGLPVSHISKWNTEDVAEYCVGVMLSLNKGVFEYNRSTHVDKIWDYTLCSEIRRIGKQTVGLLGFGNIPKLIAERLKPFGCKIIAYDPFVNPQKAMDEYGVQLMPLEEVFANANIISVHLPVTKETMRLINDENIEKMKDNVIFLNSSRGLVVDENALVKAVDSGKIRYAAIDVVDDENSDMNIHPFSYRDNIILTPHIAWYSKDAILDGIVESALNVRNFAEGNYSKVQIVNGVKL